MLAATGGLAESDSRNIRMADAISPPPAAPSKGKVFLRRLTSSVILWTIVLSALFSGHKLLSDYVFLLIMMVLAGFGLAEFYAMVEKRGLACFKVIGIVGGLALMMGTFLHVTGKLGIHGTPARVNDFETSFLILFVLGLCLRQFFSKANASGILAVSTTLFGLMYVPWLLNFVQKITFFPFPTGSHLETGHFYVLYFILVTKFSDMGAYCIGSLIGKHKMIPRVSPGKTWEGFGGAIVVSTGVSLLFAHLAGPRLYGMTWVHAAILGVVLSVAAVMGDLIESIFKREAGLKDSGKFFPGIGGILDLLDSLLFNAPLMYLYLRHVLTHD
ncbi:MAG: CDP-archaeol synthase [Opitutaceae bacterium]|nr:CDP-archaeol synthase [Verrucomicrobiales bacterium]